VPSLLHIGCGRSPLPAWLGEKYDEIRLDIDPDVQPDIVASMTHLGDIGPFDLVYTTHCLEHLYPDEVPVALEEIRRVLKPGGGAIIIVPDLEGIKATDDVVYESPAGPITGHDMIYGMAAMVADNRYMAHRCGFVRESLDRALASAGFARRDVARLNFSLYAVVAA
jgi:predicted SAM-dependent methyltransferase